MDYQGTLFGGVEYTGFLLLVDPFRRGKSLDLGLLGSWYLELMHHYESWFV